MIAWDGGRGKAWIFNGGMQRKVKRDGLKAEICLNDALCFPRSCLDGDLDGWFA